MKRDIDLQKLQKTLLRSNRYRQAELLTNRSTKIEVYPARFLTHYQIYRMLYNSPYKPFLYYFGCTLDSSVYFLVNSPQNYVELAKADGVELATMELAVEYATVFLEVTRNMSVLVYLVNSVNEIEFYGKLTPEAAQARDLLYEKYRTIITPPTAEVLGEDYIVTAYVVRQQELEHHALKISRKGDVESHINVLEYSMPVVMGL